jgi:hypothetical protein
MIIDGEMDQVEKGMRVIFPFRKLYEEGPGGVIHYGYKFYPVLYVRVATYHWPETSFFPIIFIHKK